MRRVRSLWWVGLAAVLAATVIVLVGTRPGGTTAAAPAPPPAAQPPAAPSAAPPAAAPSAAPPPAVEVAFRYLPLWPFDSVADAAEWQKEANPGGHQPWHLSAELTALAFTNGYLQFTTVDRALSTKVRGDQAWVTVGYRLPNGADSAAAVLHLTLIGRGDQRPWEVVGSEDTTLSLTTPAYGARVSSPVTAGGRITGVDESLRVQVRGTASTAPLGEVAGIAAGGQNQPWSATVPFAAADGTVRTLVVSTASHINEGIGRFAITGVRVG